MLSNLLLASTLFLGGVPEAKIIGPESGQIGELIILDASSSVAVKNYLWKPPKEIENDGKKHFLQVESGAKAIFSTGTMGVYTFVLVVSSEDGGISLIEHEVKVVGFEERAEGVINPPKPVKVPLRTIPNPPVIEDLAKEWMKNVTSPNKIDEAHKLAGVFKTVANLIKTTNITQESEVIKATRTMLQKEFNSNFVNWTEWLEDLRRYLETNRPEDLTAYQILWTRISTSMAGLK